MEANKNYNDQSENVRKRQTELHPSESSHSIIHQKLLDTSGEK